MGAEYSQTESNPRRIVLLGKTGSGKSSLANTILQDKDVFKVFHTSTSGTTTCVSETKTINGREIQVIDTPGLFDTEQKGSPDFHPEILNCMIECADGVHAFLLVLRVERYTKHEQSVPDIIGKQFSEEALKYTTVVFTQGDQLPEGMTIKEWLLDNKDLNKLMQKFGGRCHVFDNKHWNNSQDPYRNNQVQVKELLETIDKAVEGNGGKCYTNENLKIVQEKLNEEIARLTAAPENANMSSEEIKKKAKDSTFNYIWAMIGGGSGLLAAMLGVVFFFKR